MNTRRVNRTAGIDCRRKRPARLASPFAFLLMLALVGAFVSNMFFSPNASASADATNIPGIDNKKAVPDYDVNLTKAVVANPTSAQLSALTALQANLNDRNVTVRWDKSTGSVDTLMDFASAPATP